MSTDAQPQVVRSYLAGLEAALSDVPSEVSREIVAGIAEELDGLDPATAATRIEALGDPVFIAAEARAGTPPVAEPVAPAAVVAGESWWYVVLVALLVGLLPMLGWIVGIVMMWLSKSWFKWEKWVATLIPAVFAVIVPLSGNGLLGLTGWHFLVILMFFPIPAIVGLWLLWRGLRTGSRRLTRRER
jgi:hypothetical protein